MWSGSLHAPKEFTELQVAGEGCVCSFFKLCRPQPLSSKRALKQVVLQDALTEAAVKTYDHIGDVRVAVQSSFPCDKCAYVGDSRSALQTHEFRIHNCVSVASMKVKNVWCPVCMMRYTSIAGVVQHLAGSQLCGLNIIRYDELPLEQISENLDANAAYKQANKTSGWHAFKSDIPAVRMIGPYLTNTDMEGHPIQAKNGHPLGGKHQWHLANYFRGRFRGFCKVESQGFPAGFFVPCTRSCTVCYGVVVADAANER